MSDEDVITKPMPDGSFVETAFGREDFRQIEEDKAKRKYTDKYSAKANNLDPRAVRKWANEMGIPTGKRGKFSSVLIALYMTDKTNVPD